MAPCHAHAPADKTKALQIFKFLQSHKKMLHNWLPWKSYQHEDASHLCIHMYFLLNYALVSFGKQKQTKATKYILSFFLLSHPSEILGLPYCRSSQKGLFILKENKVIKLTFCLQENEVFGTVTSTSHVIQFSSSK